MLTIKKYSTLVITFWLPKRFSVAHDKLCHDNDSLKGILVIISLVTPNLLQAIELLKSLIHVLLSCTYTRFHLHPPFIIPMICGRTNATFFSTISKVCFNFFASLQFSFKILTKNINIRPRSTRERTVCPTDIACLDT